ncbi:hypothetical protein GCM10027275_35240 [Rhabdobacter roseus]|uniref:Uncharacterized protein n=1 Tax=Rhabdobacter roseus TaxID=1655419 RepID=A0A840TPH7_9BACT|nr:hypothetical protein [Rhabdobacter roseus]MBB5285254.1 hypothetical protein [Rhabdobacter roseus]
MSKKIRGLKRRQHDIDRWVEFNKSVDLDRLKKNRYQYVKPKVGPWANLYNDKPYPKNYRRQLLTHLIDFYFNWKQVLDREFEIYYLKLWIQYPRFIDSQLIVAIEDKISHYENFEQIKVDNREFPLKEFQTEKERILQFDWHVYSDIDVYFEIEFTETKAKDYYSLAGYNAEQRLYRRLLSDNVPSRTITDNEGNSQRLFYEHKGHRWIGELKQR